MITTNKAKSIPTGLYKYGDCGEQSTVSVETIFEDSILLNKWFHAIYLLCFSKKGMGAHQVQRTLGITYNSACGF